MSSPPSEPRFEREERKPVTLLKLAELRALGEPIVMVTAYDHPSALVAEDAGVDVVLVGDSAANNVLGYRDTVPITLDEILMLVAGRPPRPADTADGRRPAVRHLRGIRRAGDRDRPPLRQGGGLRRGQARRRRPDGPARPRDRRGRHAGDGPRRPDPADGDGARRLPRPGPHRRARAAGARGRARAPGGGLLLDRLRGDPRRADRPDHGAHGDPGHRDRRGCRAPTARCSSSTTCSGSTTRSSPSSSSATRSCAARWSARSRPTPRRCGRAPSPGRSTSTASLRRRWSG